MVLNPMVLVGMALRLMTMGVTIGEVLARWMGRVMEAAAAAVGAAATAEVGVVMGISCEGVRVRRGFFFFRL